MKNLAFQKKSKKTLLHQRANHQSCQPETITSENQHACRDLSAWNRPQKSHSLHSQNVDPSRAYSTCKRKYSLEQAAFWHKVKVVCCLPTHFLHSRYLFALTRIRDKRPAQNNLTRNLRKIPTHWHFNSLTAEIQLSQTYQKRAEEGRKVKLMITGSLSPFLFPGPPTFCMPFSFTSSPLSESLEQARFIFDFLHA